MGVNNRKRRAAKQRRQDRQERANAESRSHARGGRPPGDEWCADEAGLALVELKVTAAVRRLARGKIDDTDLLARTESLLRTAWPHPRELVEVVLAGLVSQLAERVRKGGWGSADLQQLVLRNAGKRHLPVLRTALEDPARLRFGNLELLSSGLAVAARLCTAPLLAGDDAADPAKGPRAEHPKLAQARALLAKAESTEYDAEAESLTAKAQELISRYALGRLVEGSTNHHASVPISRRIWLDAPYVRAKASLVHEVASANRCHTASADALGFTVVVGARADIDAVELLVTSLLFQADTAMLRHGRALAHDGRSRTRSFRQSFLLAYATRIGDRLREATREATVAVVPGQSLPVLRDQAGRVSAAFEAMVPHTVARSTKISSHDGWRAGLAAAELALLDVNGKLTERRG